MKARPTRRPTPWRVVLAAAVAVSAVLLSPGCIDRESSPTVLTADLPLHLEDHLDVAAIEGSEVPADLHEAVEWRFDEAQPDWQSAFPFQSGTEPATLVQGDDALRLIFEEENFYGLYVDLPAGWQPEEWAHVAVEARAQPGPAQVRLGFNLEATTGRILDMLPTILDLAGLPPAEIAQGQSLGRLLLGTEGWEPRPVILDEFEVVPETGELTGQIEVIDGRWGASLEVNPRPEGEGPWLDSLGRGRPARLLLYDLWKDPTCLHSLHGERPDLVEKYTTFLEAQWEAHQALAQRFTPGQASPLTPEQLRTLRSLGYIR